MAGSVFLSQAMALFLAAMFVWHGWWKWRSPADFAAAIRDHAIVPGASVRYVAGLLIVLESAIALMLLIPAARGLGLVSAAALLGAYGGVIVFNLARGRRNIGCGCSWGGQHSPDEGRLTRYHAVRPLVLAGFALCGAVAREFPLLAWPGNPATSALLPAGLLWLAVAAASVLFVLLVAADLLIENWERFEIERMRP